MSTRNAGPASLTLLPGSEQPAWPGLRDQAFALPLAETARLFPGLWGPASAASNPDADIEDALRPPSAL